MAEKVKLYIPRSVYNKVMYWVDKADTNEVGGMGTISYDAKGNYFWIRDAFLVKQEVTGSTTDLDDKALALLEHQHLKNKSVGELNFWWHSHVKMGVFWSATDKETINAYSAGGYCVATVFNQKREFRTAVNTKVKTEYGSETFVFIDEVETEIYDPPVDKAIKAQWDADFDEMVKPKTYTRQSWSYNSGSTAEESEQLALEKFGTGKPVADTFWKCQTEQQMNGKLHAWRKWEPTIGTQSLDHEYCFYAACTNMHPTVFEISCIDFTNAQWDKLADWWEKFQRDNPNFKWSNDGV